MSKVYKKINFATNPRGDLINLNKMDNGINDVDTKTQNLPANGSFNPINYAQMQTAKSVQTVNSTTTQGFATIGIPSRNGTYLVSVRARITSDNGMKYAESITRGFGTQLASTTMLNNAGDNRITLNQLAIHASLEAIVVGFTTTTPQQLQLEISWIKLI